MKIKKKIANVFIGIGAICILVALGLAIANEYENRESYRASQGVMDELLAQVGQPGNEADGTDSGYGDENGMDGIFDESEEMSVITIDGNDYIGYIGLDALDVQLPVMSYWNDSKLRIAPCRYSGSLMSHDLVIAGHNYRNGFRQLKQLKVGDYLYFMTATGVIHRFQVGALEVIDATGIEEMVNSQWDLSLYTCTYEGTMRFTVRCMEVQ